KPYPSTRQPNISISQKYGVRGTASAASLAAVFRHLATPMTGRIRRVAGFVQRTKYNLWRAPCRETMFAMLAHISIL
ncbi:MAG: hypothetical protein V3R25_04930, partial [Nitrosomonadaceae bacterium]